MLGFLRSFLFTATVQRKLGQFTSASIILLECRSGILLEAALACRLFSSGEAR